MKINQINNTNFKQTYMPNYNRYTDVQKQIGDDIKAKMDAYEIENESFNSDILVTRLGKKNSLYVFRCHKSFDYKSMSDVYANKLFVGKYDTKHSFNPEDIEKANNSLVLNSLKTMALTFLATVTATLGLTAKRSHRF